MKKFLLLLAVCAFLPAPGTGASTDCAKSSDACRPLPAALTPFMAELKQAAQATELKQGPAANSRINSRKPAVQPKAAAPAPATTADSEPPVKKETFSRPGWLLAAALFLCGLYYFLKEGRKKGKK